MKLQQVLDAYGNPMGKLYNPHSGALYLPCGVDAGEVKYLMIVYDPQCRTWRPDRKSSLVDVSKLKAAVGVSEEDLMDMADRAWAESA